MGILKGEKIASRGNGYTLVIPPYSDPNLQKFHQEATNYAGRNEIKRRIGMLVDFVHRNISYDETWNAGKKEVSLSISLETRKGVCKEKAAILSMLLQMEGFPNEFKRGTFPGEKKRERHAWVKVNVDGEPFLADPEQLLFGKYDSVFKKRGYVEDQ